MHKNRIKKLQAKVAKASFDAYLVEDPTDLYYLTGVPLSAGRYVITPNESHLYVDGRYTEACKHIPAYSIEEDAFKNVKVLGFNKEKTSYARYESIKNKELVPSDDLVADLRLIKDEEELSFLRKSAELGSKGYDYIRSLLKEGISEIDLAVELDIFWKRAGGEALAFDPIIAFGSSSSMPHYHPRKKLLKKGDLVLLDIGVTLNHYHSDMTRVEFFGAVDPELEKIFSIVREAQSQALKLCKPGTLIGALDAAARDYIASKGYGELFMHGLGHGIGLEVHEGPVLKNKEPFKDKALQEGMVITIEPGIYLAGKGGVRLEDTVAITADGYENLTNRPIIPNQL